MKRFLFFEKIHFSFLDNLNNDERADFDDLWNKIKDVESDHPVFQYNNESTGSGNQTHCDSSKLRWTYYNSLFFSFTAITTIGTCLFWIMHLTTYLGALSKRDTMKSRPKTRQMKGIIISRKNIHEKIFLNLIIHTFCKVFSAGTFSFFLHFSS